MGNQLTSLAPAQILPVEEYLRGQEDLVFETSLGSTRFLKVARARHHEGAIVVKVFVIPDLGLPLRPRLEQLESIHERLANVSNCLPFVRVHQTERSVQLHRPYIMHSLYDRMSTRPFLIDIEKQWIAFQLLCAITQCHKMSVCHGDIKSENVLLTSWGWLFLTDFAPFKPTFLPSDNPHDFDFFFDTSRRRTCYLAPERFIDPEESEADRFSGPDAPDDKMEMVAFSASMAMSSSAMSSSAAELTPAMDLFSIGCVLLELYTDGESTPFTLSSILAYRADEYSPWKLLDRIENADMRELVRTLLQKNPKERLSGEDLLLMNRGRAFPETFYSYLKSYMLRFAAHPILSADDRIVRVKRDLALIQEKLVVRVEQRSDENNALLMIVSLVTSSVRNLRYAHAKLEALRVLTELSRHLVSHLVLGRCLPFMLYLVKDVQAAVRAEALRCITLMLSSIDEVLPEDMHIFPDYLLPSISALTADPVAHVRMIYAENITALATIALRFLETVHHSALIQQRGAYTKAVSLSSKASLVNEGYAQIISNYDADLQTLHERIRDKTQSLLQDPDTAVKQTFVSRDMPSLCVFFGRRKAADLLISHMITFLNEKDDAGLRAAFFEHVVGVAAYVGSQACDLLVPLLEQGLSEVDERVLEAALRALQRMAQLGVLTEAVLTYSLPRALPLLNHPDRWIRQATVGLLTAFAACLKPAAVHIKLIEPLRQDGYLREAEICPPILADPTDPLLLLSSLRDPLSRKLYDMVSKAGNGTEKLLEALQERQLIRNITRAGQVPNYAEMDQTVALLFGKLVAQGLTEQKEDQIVALREILLKLARSLSFTRDALDNSIVSVTPFAPGQVDLSLCFPMVQRRHADLTEFKNISTGSSVATPSSKKVSRMAATPSLDMPSVNASLQSAASSSSKFAEWDGALMSPTLQSSNKGARQKMVKSASVAAFPRTGPGIAAMAASGNQMRCSPCRVGLRQLVDHKREVYKSEQVDRSSQQLLHQAHVLDTWKPRGLLLSSMEEHVGAVHRIAVHPQHIGFATAGADGLVRLWDVGREEASRTVTERSKLSYSALAPRSVLSVAWPNSTTLLAVTDTCLHLINVDSSQTRWTISLNRTSEAHNKFDGKICCAESAGEYCSLVATSRGTLLCFDSRQAPDAPCWRLSAPSLHGLPTAMVLHSLSSWAAVGSSRGNVDIWDMRFGLALTCLEHPSKRRITRLVTCPDMPSRLLVAAQGNNEVSLWDMEAGSRLRTLWASLAPALSRTQTSVHSTLALAVSQNCIITGGTDCRLRRWDLEQPETSCILASKLTDAWSSGSHYRVKVVEGVECLVELYPPRNTQGSSSGGAHNENGVGGMNGLFDRPSGVGFSDAITDIAVLNKGQPFLLTATQNGAVKIWK